METLRRKISPSSESKAKQATKYHEAGSWRRYDIPLGALSIS
jgi:hypothetical protein